MSERRPGRRKPALTLCATVLVASLPVAAWPETLVEAWEAAIEAHQLVAAAKAQRDAARQELDSAMAERYPRIDLESTFTQLDSAPRFTFDSLFVSPKFFSGDNFVTASAQVSLPMYTSGRISHGIDAARSIAEASRSQLDVVTQDIKLGTAERYISVLRAESAVAVAQSNVATLDSHTADARKRFELGAAPQNDFLAASVSLANARQSELQVANQFDLARSAYNRFLGRRLTAPVNLDARLHLEGLLPPGRDLDTMTELAIEDRRELRTLASRAEALRAQSSAERARVKPHLALAGGYSMLENDVLDEERFWTVGVALQWNLFDSGRSNSRAAALDLTADALMHERADRRSLIALEVRRAWLDRQEAEGRRVVADAAVAQAVENLRVVRDRYNAGAGTNTEVLDAEALRTVSLNNRDNARWDVALATLRLARAIGAL